MFKSNSAVDRDATLVFMVYNPESRLPPRAAGALLLLAIVAVHEVEMGNNCGNTVEIDSSGCHSRSMSLGYSHR